MLFCIVFVHALGLNMLPKASHVRNLLSKPYVFNHSVVMLVFLFYDPWVNSLYAGIGNLGFQW